MTEHNLLPIDRLFRRVQKVESGCWEFTGAKDKFGYGMLWLNGGSIRTHRYVYEHYFGEIPDGLTVLHICDNPCCVNPDHLMLGTRADNNHDRDRKGRGVALAGVNSPRAKFDWIAIGEIRERYRAGWTVNEIARLYNVNRSTVYNIVNRVTYKESPDECSHS